MGNKIIHKKSIISGNMPPLSSLSAGEIAINAADGYIFFKKNSESDEYLSKFVDQHGHSHVLNESLSSFVPQFGGNTTSEVFASVLGGFQNNVSGAASSVVNGENNDIYSDFSFIGTGINNKITFNGNYSFNAAGQNNLIQHENCFTLGSNLSSHSNNFTYVNNISANGKLYGNGSELTGIVGADLNVSNLVKSNSANWNSVYSSVKNVSSSLDSVYSNVNWLSSNWTSVYNNVNGLSSNWNSVYNNVNGLSSNWNSVYTSTNNTSGNWNSVYTTTQSKSATEWDNALSNAYADSKFLPLTGGTVSGSISATGVISASASNVRINVINSSSNRTFSDADNNRVIHIDTTTSSLCAIFPSSLSNGFNVAIMNTGTNNLVLSAASINSLGTTIPTRYGGAFVYKDSGNLFAVGRLV